MENRFKVVYSGELQPYVSAQEAVRNVAALFKVSEDRIRGLVLGGHVRDVKVDVDQATADRYVSALSKAGLAVRIEPMVAPKPELQLTSLGLEETTESTPAPAAERCPKCGAAEVRDGICGACGVAVAKYRAQLAAGGPPLPGSRTPGGGATRPGARTRVDNPYAPPRAELTPEPRVVQGEERLTGPHAVPAGHGWGWISRGFWHFKDNPWTWILITVTYFLIILAVSLVPILGGIVVYLIGPIFTGGLMLGAYDQGHGERLGFHHLFAGFSNHTGRLVAAGLIYLGGIVLATIPVMLVVGLPMMMAMAGMDSTMLDQDPQLMAQAMDDLLPTKTIILAALVAFLLMLPLAMAYWFAPALIAIDGMRTWQAMKLSLLGCVKNILPFLVYGLMGLLLIMLGSLPMLLGLLVVMPALTASIYVSYRDIFYRKV